MCDKTRYYQCSLYNEHCAPCPKLQECSFMRAHRLFLPPKVGVSAGGEFAPTDLSTLHIWQRGSSLLGLSEGDPITTMSDESGNGYDLVMNVAANKPTYRANAINSLPAIEVKSGGGEIQWITNAAAPPAALGDFTVAAVFKELRGAAGMVVNFGQWSTFLGVDCGGVGDPYMLYLKNSGYKYYNDLSHTSGTFDIGIWWKTGNDYHCMRNGVESGTVFTVAGEDTEQGYCLGSQDVGALVALGHTTIAELVICSNALDATDRGKLLDYLNTVYAVY